jgi:hypothetical protein
LKGKWVAVFLLALCAAVGYAYISASTGGEEILNDPAEKINMTLVVEGDSGQARVRYYELDSPAIERVVNLPFQETVFTASTKISATALSRGARINCAVLDGSTEKILDKDGPGKAVNCSHSTF